MFSHEKMECLSSTPNIIAFCFKNIMVACATRINIQLCIDLLLLPTSVGSFPSILYQHSCYTSPCNGIALSSKYFSYSVAAERGLGLNFNLPQFTLTRSSLLQRSGSVWTFISISI